ncbi:hypothetical protein AGMMS49936_10050 [Endomicrobiia bacterium]|nr:hypothetical protein AGMMS49936_10050 [Endomicrobiia bacterium]
MSSSCVTNNKCLLVDTRAEDFLSKVDEKFLKYKNCVQSSQELMNMIHRKHMYNSVNAKLTSEKINERNKIIEDLRAYLQKSLSVGVYKKFKRELESAYNKRMSDKKKASSNFVELLKYLNSIIKKSEKNLSIEIDKAIIEYAKAKKSRYAGTLDCGYQSNYALLKLSTLFNKVKNNDIAKVFLYARDIYVKMSNSLVEIQDIGLESTMHKFKEYIIANKNDIINSKFNGGLKSI